MLAPVKVLSSALHLLVVSLLVPDVDVMEGMAADKLQISQATAISL